MVRLGPRLQARPYCNEGSSDHISAATYVVSRDSKESFSSGRVMFVIAV